MDTAQLIAQACPKIGALGGAFYFAPETLATGKARGLDGFRFYFLGRGGVLGDVESPVVCSAFGYWNPELVATMWNSAREKMAPRDAGRLYAQCAAEFGRAKLSGVANLDAYNAAAEQVIAAADPAGLALFAGVAAEPRVDDAAGRAMQVTAVLRELRGSAHLVAVLAAGVSPRIAHYIRRPEMYKTFGWGEEGPEVSDADRTALADADALTDRLVTPAYGVLDAAGAEALADGATALEAALKG